jgi:sugar lactone lactonase YvrE
MVNRFRPGDGRATSLEVGQPVGAVALRERGGLVLAVRDGFGLLDPGSREVKMVAPIEANLAANRMNDGKCDPAGRFWAGTMDVDDQRGRGALYRLGTDLGVSRVLRGVTTSNGVDWSPDGQTMYYVDSGYPTIDAFDFDGSTGTPSRRRTLVALDPGDGTPDGLTVDAEGQIWLALWDGWEVRRYTPDGAPGLVVRLPVGRVTSCIFGGADLSDLYITSAWFGLSDEERAAQPHAGGVFRCRPGVSGRPARRFAG